MQIGTLRMRHGGKNVDIPVVSIGSSPVASKLRARVSGTTGEIPLVQINDSRASKLRVRQDGTVYAIASDARREITHTSGINVSKRTSSNESSSYLLGETTFNRATKVTIRVELGIVLECANWTIDAKAHYGTNGVILRLRNASTDQTYSSSRFSASISQHHPGFSTYWISDTINRSSDISLSVPPGEYIVSVDFDVSMEKQTHSSMSALYEQKILWWKEEA